MKRINSRQKGARGERELAAFLSEHGFKARRGQQFAGGPDSPDVLCELLDWLHMEVKRTERLNLRDACAQAEGDSKGKPWGVISKWNHGPWLCTVRLEVVLGLILGILPPRSGRIGEEGSTREMVETTVVSAMRAYLAETTGASAKQSYSDRRERTVASGASRTGEWQPYLGREFRLRMCVRGR